MDLAKKKQVIDAYKAGTPVESIMLEFEVSSSTIYRWLKDESLGMRYGDNQVIIDSLSKEQVDQAVKMYRGNKKNSPKSIKIVARHFKVSPIVMRAILTKNTKLRRYTVAPKKPRQASVDLKNTVTQLIQSGKSYGEVAAELKIHPAHVYRICPVQKTRKQSAAATLIDAKIKANPDITPSSLSILTGLDEKTVIEIMDAVREPTEVPAGNINKRIAEAQALYNGGMPMAAVAAQMKCSENWLNRVITTRTRSEAAIKAWERRRSDHI